MKFEVYQSVSQWRWRLKASNGKIVAESGESYWNQQDCLDGIKLVMGTSTSTEIKYI